MSEQERSIPRLNVKAGKGWMVGDVLLEGHGVERMAFPSFLQEALSFFSKLRDEDTPLVFLEVHYRLCETQRTPLAEASSHPEGEAIGGIKC